MRRRWVTELIPLREGMKTRGTLTGLKSEPVWTHASYTWAGAIPCPNTGWGMNTLRTALRRRTWEYWWTWKTSRDLEMCDISTESQLCPGLHQKKCGQQVEGGVSAPVLHSHEIPPRVLHPALVSATQERCESVVGGPEEGHVDAQWDGTLLPGR